jgi:hypothetical protein
MVRTSAETVGLAASLVVKIWHDQRPGTAPSCPIANAFAEKFHNAVETESPLDKATHVMLDNYANHKRPKVRAWRARHPRWTFHVAAILAAHAQCR